MILKGVDWGAFFFPLTFIHYGVPAFSFCLFPSSLRDMRLCFFKSFQSSVHVGADGTDCFFSFFIFSFFNGGGGVWSGLVQNGGANIHFSFSHGHIGVFFFCPECCS